MKKRDLVTGALVIATVLGSIGCAGKFSHNKIKDKMFLKYDTNKDGYVNKKEHLEIAINRFYKADNNEDGKVTKVEIEYTRFGKIFPSMVENFFKKNDLDKDGVVTKTEIISNSKEEFMKSDINYDNKLSKNEMKEYRINSKFESMDENKDGLISKDEYKKQKSTFDK